MVQLQVHVEFKIIITFGVGVHCTQVISLKSPPAWMRRGRRSNEKFGGSSLGGSGATDSSRENLLLGVVALLRLWMGSNSGEAVTQNIIHHVSSFFRFNVIF